MARRSGRRQSLLRGCRFWNATSHYRKPRRRFDYKTVVRSRHDSMKAVAHPLSKSQTDGLGTFWTQTPEAICATLHCGLEGLSSDEAKRRLAQYGPNSDAETRSDGV